MRGHWFALQENRWFFTNKEQKTIELVARPDQWTMMSIGDFISPNAKIYYTCAQWKVTSGFLMTKRRDTYNEAESFFEQNVEPSLVPLKEVLYVC